MMKNGKLTARFWLLIFTLVCLVIVTLGVVYWDISQYGWLW